MLTHGKIAITDQERDDILALARQMKLDDRVSGASRPDRAPVHRHRLTQPVATPTTIAPPDIVSR